MLSTQTTQASQSHRRQNSSPTSDSTIARASYNPAHHTNPHSTHRRGLSTDVVMQIHGLPTTTKQEYRMVNTNLGPQSQHSMRAAQMPASARPGTQDNEIEYSLEYSNEFDPSWRDVHRTGVSDSDMALFGSSYQIIQEPQGHASGFLNMDDPFAMPEQTRYKQEVPQTPIKESFSDRYPMTPITETRHYGQSMPQPLQTSPVRRGPYGTIKAPKSLAMKRGSSSQDSTAMMRQLSDTTSIPSPSAATHIGNSSEFELAPMPSASLMDAPELSMDFLAHGDYSSSSYSQSPSASSFQSSPELAPISLFGEFAAMRPNYPAVASQSDAAMSSDCTTSKRKAGSPTKLASSTKGSDSEPAFNPMDYMHNDTGITEEEINAHIQGPDAEGKYYCLHEECVNGQSNTRKENVFGRKENIRAHVQTHLDDRRFECDVCYKRFVRPNDLKRHWNIHLNKRDFKCVCKAAFNRHDALKRHRERSEYCESGGKRGIPGSPKKEEKKRGRPRKIAPTENDERRERKALLRRQLLQKKQASTASSVASSQPSPPPSFDIPELQRYQSASKERSPNTASFTPPASPGYTADDIFSPMHSQSYCTPKEENLSPPPTRGSITSSLGLSTHSVDQINGFEMDFLSDPVLPNASSPSRSNASQYGTPPELELSSSSPSAGMVDFSFVDTLEPSPQTAIDNSFLDEMMTKSSNDNFDKVLSFVGNSHSSDSYGGVEDIELFRDTLQDEVYWAK